jgi:MFS family permease
MLPAGVYVERHDKRSIVILMQTLLMLQAFALAFLAITGRITIWQIVLLSFIAGLANSIEITARQAMIIELVEDRTIIPNAIALNSTIFNTARVIGPMLAAPFMLLLQDKGEGWAFFANGVSFMFVIVGLLFVNTRSVIPLREEGRSLFAEFMEGQRFVRKTPVVAMLILMVTVMAFFGFPYTQQLPVFARDVLRELGDTAAAVATRNSLLITAQGIGAFIAAISLALFSNVKRKGFFLSIGQITVAGGLIALSFTRRIGTAMPIMALLGWGTVTQLALTNTLIQLAAPNELRGRVISTYFWAMQGAAPFGSLLVGWMAQSWGAPLAVAIGGGVCLLTAMTIHSTQPVIRQATGSEA